MRYIPKNIQPKPKFIPTTNARWFREVIEAVESGLEEIGTECSKSEYDFKKPDDVDTSIETNIFVEKQSIGADVRGFSSFEDRLADRLGLSKKVETTNETDTTPAV